MKKSWQTVSGFIFILAALIFSLGMAGAANGKSSLMPAATAVFTANIIQGEPDQPTLYLEMPPSAAVGETITARLLADNVANLAGFQA